MEIPNCYFSEDSFTYCFWLQFVGYTPTQVGSIAIVHRLL